MRAEKISHLFEEKWFNILKPFIESSQFDDIITNLKLLKQTGKYIIPQDIDCFNAFKYCPYDKLKVVILGQDPYCNIIYNKPEAHGLAFSYKPVNETDFHIPPSLNNILKEVNDDVYQCNFEDMMYIENPNLTRWAEQGVLLLNTALTTEHKETGIHIKLWKPFISYVIQYLNQNNPGLIWMLWGADAKSYKDSISNTHHILEAGHPSPNNTTIPFLGCKHFTKANDLIKQMNGKREKITW